MLTVKVENNEKSVMLCAGILINEIGYQFQIIWFYWALQSIHITNSS